MLLIIFDEDTRIDNFNKGLSMMPGKNEGRNSPVFVRVTRRLLPRRGGSAANGAIDLVNFILDRGFRVIRT